MSVESDKKDSDRRSKIIFTKDTILWKKFSKFGNPREVMESVNREASGNIQKRPDVHRILDASLSALKSGAKVNFTPFSMPNQKRRPHS